VKLNVYGSSFGNRDRSGYGGLIHDSIRVCLYWRFRRGKFSFL